MPERKPDPPRPVTTACWLMIVGVGLSAVTSVMVFAQASDITDPLRTELDQQGEQVIDQSLVDLFVTWYRVVVVVQAVIIAGLWIFMAVKNGQGRKWARMLATVFGAFNAVSVFNGGVTAGFRSTAGLDVELSQLLVSGAGAALGGLILFLLWRPESTRYFEESTNFQTAQRLRAYRPAPLSGESNWPR